MPDRRLKDCTAFENDIAAHIEKPASRLSVLTRIFVIIAVAGYIAFFAAAVNLSHEYRAQLGQYGKYDCASYDGLDMSILNSADKESLMEVDGIGDKRAELIISFRDAVGGFTDPRQIMYLDGIGEKLLGNILEHFYDGYCYSGN